MTVALSEVQVKMIHIMQDRHERLSSGFFAGTLGISSKTIRNVLNDLGTIVIEHGAELDCCTGSGYLLVLKEPEKFTNYLQICEYQNRSSKVIPVGEERAHLIIRHLLSREGYSKIEEFERLFFLNRTTVLSDYAIAKSILERFGIEVKTKSKHGLYIEGKESDIRACLNYERYFYDHCNLGIEEIYGDYYVAEQRTYERLRNIVIENIDAYSKNNVSDTDVESLAGSLYIIAQRNKKKHVLEYDEDIHERFMARNSYYTAKVITDKATVCVNEPYTNEDNIYVAIFIIANRSMMRAEDFSIRNNYLTCREMAFALTRYLQEINEFEYIGKDLQLIDDLSMNMLQISTRMEFHLYTTYRYIGIPLGLMARQLAIQSAVYMNEKYSILLDEDEIYKLALIIHPVFGRFPFTFRPSRALVISQVNKSVAKGVAERLQRNYGSKIQDFVPCSIYELKTMNLDHFDFIFTAYPSEFLPELPEHIKVINVDIFFSEEQKMKIRRAIISKLSNNMTNSLGFAEWKFERDVNAKSKDEVFQYIATYIESIEGTRPGVYESLKKSDQYYESSDYDNVVYLAPLEGHTKEARVVIFVLKKALQWKHHKAQLIVYWDRGCTKVDEEHFENESLPHLISLTISDESIKKQLIDGKNIEHLEELITYKNEQVLMNGQSFK